jgi:hypothetical protein
MTKPVAGRKRVKPESREFAREARELAAEERELAKEARELDKHSWDRSQLRLGRASLIAQLAGFVAIVVTLTFTVFQLKAATRAIDINSKQLQETKYESVYGHQLDLWKLAAEDENFAPYILGEESLEPPTQAQPATPLYWTQRAALTQALDFYTYVFSQLAPDDEENLNGSEDDPARDNVSEGDWEAWLTWAATIRQGFRGAPTMCRFLQDDKDAYGVFYEVVMNTRVDQTPLCPR